MERVESYARDRWFTGGGEGRPALDAVTGEVVATVSSDGLDFDAMVRHAKEVGGPALRAMTFHDRARALKACAKALTARKDELYALSHRTGATQHDAWTDVDGGVGTFFVYASKARRELPDDRLMREGAYEPLGRQGTFGGQHVWVPRRGVAVHINAYNFPVWGMLEKLAPNLLAGVPAIVKPASVTSYVTAHAVRILAEAKALPEGALQLIAGGIGDLFDHLDGQDVVTFTGSATTGRMLRGHGGLLDHNVRFNMEADSLNFCLLGPDATPGTPEFDLFVKEVADEMRIKTGQRCTAIRRALVPRGQVGAVSEALRARFRATTIGDPRQEGVQMGPLVSLEQRAEVRKAVAALTEVGEVVFADLPELAGADGERGAFHPFTLLHCSDPMSAAAVHDVEAFGPVSTLLPYDDLAQAGALIRRGQGSLCGTLVTADDDAARTLVLETASHHGRLQILNRDCAGESTGHGSPMPHLVHGGPGRAGGGEELGGLRGLSLYMQRTALQGSPSTLTRVGGEWLPGAARPEAEIHPFRKTFDELEIGETLTTHRRTVTEGDIGAFAGLSGDYFYAHVDEVAASRSPLFGGRVAHGYFVLSMAAGLFVHPAEGPVLANYGLESLRFTKPVKIGSTLHAKLTVEKKTPQDPRKGEEPRGVVQWHVDVLDQDAAVVATYSILTLVRRSPAGPR